MVVLSILPWARQLCYSLRGLHVEHTLGIIAVVKADVKEVSLPAVIVALSFVFFLD